MIVRALEGFLLHNDKLPTRQDIAALNTIELHGENMLHLYPALGECIGVYDGPPLPEGWRFVLPSDLPEELKPLLLMIDALTDLEQDGTELPDGFLEVVKAQDQRSKLRYRPTEE